MMDTYKNKSFLLTFTKIFLICYDLQQFHPVRLL